MAAASRSRASRRGHVRDPHPSVCLTRAQRRRPDAPWLRLLARRSSSRTTTRTRSRPSREGLEDEGYAVYCAASGTEGLELARAKRPDLVLTDLMMPGMDGLVFLKTLRKLDPFLPVVIITGQGSVETAVEALKEGAYDYLAKPVRLKDVLKLVSGALEVQARVWRT